MPIEGSPDRTPSVAPVEGPDQQESKLRTRPSWISNARRRLKVPRSTLVAWGVLALPVLGTALAFWPGRINIDTLGQIAGVASGQFTNLHAPLLEALWSPLWDLGARPGAVLTGQVLALVVGAYLVLRAAFRPIGAAAVTALIALSPPVFANLGSVMRDTWFAALLLLAFGLVVQAAQRPWPSRGRYLALALVAAWLTLASRQNAPAAVALACMAIAGLFLARRRESASEVHGRAQARRLYGVLGAVAGGIVLTLGLMATQLAASTAIGVEDVHPEAPVFIYDLAAISQREDENLFPSDLMPRRGMAPVDRAFSVDSMLTFIFPPRNRVGLGHFAHAVGYPRVQDPAARSLRDAWWEAVRDHPGAYIGERWTLWLRQIGITRDALSVYPPDMPDNGGFGFRFPWFNEKAMSYVDAFTQPEASFYGQAGGNWIFTTFVYLLAALAGAVVLLRHGRPWPLIIVGALAFSVLTYQAGLFLGAMGTRFRFEYPCVVIGMIVAAVLLRLGWARWRAASLDDAPA